MVVCGGTGLDDRYAEEFVVSVVLGDDIVPRLARQQLEDARVRSGRAVRGPGGARRDGSGLGPVWARAACFSQDEIFRLMAYCNRNKTSVLLGAAAAFLPHRARSGTARGVGGHGRWRRLFLT